MTAFIYHSNQIREGEKKAARDSLISNEELMERAGNAAFSLMQHVFPHAKKILVYCGSGNNAGDGYVFARLAHEAGYIVYVNQYKLAEELPNVARRAAFKAQAAGVSYQSLNDPNDIEADLIVDALLGIGLSGEVQEPYHSAINQINDCGLPVLSIDIPSGLQADTGKLMGVAVKATLTLCLLAYKLGLFTLDGPDYCGRIVLDDLKMGSCFDAIQASVQCLEAPIWPKRLRNSYKHEFGHVLIVGGNEGMLGATALAAQAALRVGAGMVTIAIHPSHSAFFAHLPEAMIYHCEQGLDLEPLLEKASVCVVGPGLGLDDWAQNLFDHVITTHLPMIVDASALRLLAIHPQRDDNWILTPHPGEAASLLACSTAVIQQDRLSALEALQAQYGGTVVLKGVGTLIKSDDPLVSICQQGNPGMASAGMGDVLSGVIAGVASQGWNLKDAAKIGVWLHANAGDMAARETGERGLLASDLVPFLRQLVN